ncbi:ECF-type sigma factor [Rubrivirga sp. S365]|uniref:ECF-type sigma factor n=1 Tax=Rubrivirga sp. S365 TaxID=3076080 RepID=UPI0028C84443|nr:ECF-type sigma factor [Rubrivirga sp. S365]MDT7858208.1 ECF-type sigma factor [Rubrivirga sp. S365]
MSRTGDLDATTRIKGRPGSTPCPVARAAKQGGSGNVYDRLRRIAGGLHRNEHALTVGATGLVHEALLRAGTDVLSDPTAHQGAVCREMGRVAVDRARGRNALKRWGRLVRDDRTPLDEINVDPEHEGRAADGLDLRLALDRLEAVSPRLRDVVRLRYELGLSEEEAAQSLGVTARTVRRDSVKARGLLAHLVDGGPAGRTLD